MSNSKKNSGAVGIAAMAATMAGAEPKDVARIARQLVPGCGTTEASARWYSWKLRREGFEVPSMR